MVRLDTGWRRVRKSALVLVVWLAALAVSAPVLAAKIQYTFDDWAGPPLRVYATRPAGLAADRPVLIVMHGVRRNARDYRDQWHELAKRHDFLLLVPEFGERDFPGAEGYNFGYRRDSDGRPRPRERWAFAALEPLFDDARRRFGSTADRYALYGHSAGAQFVHRYLYFVPGARLARVVPANAGWYTMPDYAVAFPYGLGNASITPEDLQRALALPVTVLLGARDNDPGHPSLRRTPEAMQQGATRLERGQRFFDTARGYAEQQHIPFNWRQVLVPGVGHDNRLMAPAAVPHLLGEADD
jgi:poly(3-hydroxybutyrate) depolymerase